MALRMLLEGWALCVCVCGCTCMRVRENVGCMGVCTTQ